MLKLSKQGIKNVVKWEELEVDTPKFDIDSVIKNTKNTPKWIHFGAGNIFRGFIANAHQKLLDEKIEDTGIIAVDSFDFEVIDKVYKPYDNLSILVLMNACGSFEKKIIASVVDSIAADNNRPESMQHLTEIFENKSLQVISFTITEKGYVLNNSSGEYFGVVASDIEKGPDKPLHTMSMITSLLYKRYKKGAYPITLVSMDNCSLNGDKLKHAVITMAKEWLNKKYVEEGFVNYLLDESKVTFPISMIDKITPRPSETVKRSLEELGIEDMDIVVTSKNSYVAPFVNAEACEYLVIEDKFTNGRPKLEQAGVIFTNRESVNKVETMKVTTCLNPLHTALAVSGCLLGYKLISDEIKDNALLNMIKAIGYEEGLKVVVNQNIIEPKTFIDKVVNERFANPFIPDTPQRIATDTSQKVAIRYGETIKSYYRDKNLNTEDLVAIPMAIALWCRYLLGIDDNGNEFVLSPDPLLDSLSVSLEGIKLGECNQGQKLKPILSNSEIFGMDLYKVNLGEKIESMFNDLTAGKGAIRKTLDKLFGD